MRPKAKESKVGCFHNNLVKVLCRGATTVPMFPFFVIEGAVSRESVWEKIKLIKIIIL